MADAEKLQWMKETDLPSDDSDDADHNEADEDDQHKQQIEAEISHARLQVQQYPDYYDSHKHFVEALRQGERWEELRHAREKWSEQFVLSEDAWLRWLADEISSELTLESKQHLVKLFERSVADCLSVKNWNDYLSFLVGDLANGDSAVMNAKDVRTVFERAINTAGLHMTEGHSLWTAYIAFEGDHAEDPISAMQKIHRRQLAIPHIPYEETLEVYSAFEELRNPAEKAQQLASLKSTIDKATKETESRKEFEEHLIKHPDDIQKFFAYIDFETKQKQHDPFRVRLLYERAITVNHLQPHVWLKFTNYLDQHLKVATVVLSVHQRAIRSCGWSGDIWANYLRALERFSHDKKEIDDVYHRGRGQTFQSGDELARLHIAYIDYLRRTTEKNEDALRLTSHEVLRPAFASAINHISQSFPEGDLYFQVERYQIRLEAMHWKDMTKARELYEAVLKRAPRSSELFNEFVQLERTVGHRSHAHNLLWRAVVAKCDDPMTLFTEALNFEREEGTLESFDAMSARVQTQMALIEQAQQKEAEKAAAEAALAASSTKEKRKRGGGDEDGGFGGGKRAKTSVVTASDGPSKDAMDVDDPARPQLPKNPYRDADLQERTVFISNLAFTVTEETIRELFITCGPIESVTLVKDKSNTNTNVISKGYGHIEFRDKDAAEKAIKRDRERLNGRPIFISRFVSKKRGERREQFPTGPDERTVFVARLPFAVEEKRLKELFEQFGEVKDVRLATKKSGRSRGFAYIEFTDEMAARRALSLDGKEFEGSNLSVAMSNPPGKKDKDSDANFGFGRGKRVLPAPLLVPRQLIKKDAATTSTTTTTPSSSTEAPAKKSQNDFRKMLLGAK